MSDCARCGGIGYTVRQAGDHARADVCVCQQECDHCDGARYRIVDDEGYDIAVPCECSGVFTRVGYFNDAGIPADYGTKTLAAFRHLSGNQGRIKEAVLQYQKHFDPETSDGLVLVGAPGTGKTHLVCALLNYLCLQEGLRCHFIDFFHLTARIRATFDRSGETQENIIAPLIDVPVLAIDELGKGLGTAFEQNVVDQLISRRYNAGRIVIATTNYRPEAWLTASGRRGDAPSLEERVGERIYSRLMEMCTMHRLDGDDFRQRES